MLVLCVASLAVNLISAILSKGVSLYQEAESVAASNFSAEAGAARVLAVVNHECDRLVSDILSTFIRSERIQSAISVGHTSITLHSLTVAYFNFPTTRSHMLPVRRSSNELWFGSLWVLPPATGWQVPDGIGREWLGQPRQYRSLSD
jgi:hypothetical protein